MGTNRGGAEIAEGDVEGRGSARFEIGDSPLRFRRVDVLREIMKTTALDFPGRLRLALVIAMPLLPGAAWAEGEDATSVGPAGPIGIAVTVNGYAIPKNEVSFLLAPKLRTLVERFPEKGAEFEKLVLEARNGVMKELVDRRIVIGESGHLGIQIAPEKIEEEFQREIANAYQGDVNRLQEALKESRMTMEGYRSLLRDRLLESEIKKQLPKEK